jgi:hypothetical protein
MGIETKITKNTRKAVMIFLITLFFIISPTIILYTAGYRYDFKNNQILQTGVLSIDLKPEDATISLDGVIINKKIPIRLANRAPGIYKLEVKKPGFYTWQKNIEIQSKQTTYIKNIQLFSNSLPIKIFDSKKEIKEAKISNSGQYFLVMTEMNGIYEITMLNTKTQTFTAISRLKNLSEPYFEWSPFDDFFFITYKNSENSYSIDFFNAQDMDINKTYKITNNLNNFNWIKNDASFVLAAQTGNYIYTFDLNKTEKISKATDNIWYLDDKKDLFFANNLQNEIYNAGKKEIYKINEKISKILYVTNEVIIAKYENGFAFISRKTKNLSSISATKIYFDKENNRWLAWSPIEVWSITNEGNIALLNRFGQQIESAMPMDSYGSILFSTNSSVIGFLPEHYTTQILFDKGQIQTLGVDKKERKIYFFGSVGQTKGIYMLPY